jgi:hypothetical protein
MRKNHLFLPFVLLIVLLAQMACSSLSNPGNVQSPTASQIAGQPAATGEQPAAPAQTAEAGQPVETSQVALPLVGSNTNPEAQPPAAGVTTAVPMPTAASQPSPVLPTHPALIGQQLAFIKDGDIWLYDGAGTQPYPLTVAGDIKTFAWAPDGERLGYFNGKSLCFIQRDGSVRTACLDLGLNETQAKIDRRLLISPDQRWVVLWNPVNPWDEGAIGWLVLALDSSNTMYRIEDPTDWGASLAPNNDPGGITGQPVFLQDGRLVGTLTHRYLSSEAGRHYQLFEFDLKERSFKPYPNKPEDGFSEGYNLVLSKDGSTLANFGTFFSDCNSYVTFMDLFNLSSQNRQVFNLDKLAMADLALSPDLRQALLAQISGCSDPGKTTWAMTCGLAQGFDVLPMQVWDLSANERKDFVPGLMPAWSPDGKQVAFRSCLNQGSDGKWSADGNSPASIYLYDVANGEITRLEQGGFPQWRP